MPRRRRSRCPRQCPVDEDESEGIRILTPPAPEPEPEPEAEVVVVVEQVVVDDVVVEEVVAVAVIEEVAEEITEESPAIASDPTLDESVDDLFARIRAARADEVAKAEEVLAEPELVLLAIYPRRRGQPPRNPVPDEPEPEAADVVLADRRVRAAGRGFGARSRRR